MHDTSSALDDAVSRAVSVVARGHYVDHPELGAVPQTTALPAIERDLRRACIRAGARVLEIGTGTGYTGAVLAEIVGPTGHVVSIDIDPALTARAAKLHAERGIGNLTLLTRDGHLGAVEYAPYDAVLGWATPTLIPNTWVEQTRPGGTISTPIYIAPVARTVGHVTTRVSDGGKPVDPEVGASVYVDMAGHINTTLGEPQFYVDATNRDGSDLAWISVAWRDSYEGHDPATTLALLRTPGHTEPGPLPDDEEARAYAFRDFRAFAAATDSAQTPSSLTAYGTSGTNWTSGIGFSSGNNAAVITDDGHIITNRVDSPALLKLRDYLAAWQAAGRPGIDQTRAVLTHTDGGWHVRTAES